MSTAKRTHIDDPNWTLEKAAFDMGLDAGRAERAILDGERRSLDADRAYLEPLALILGVAKWEIMRSDLDCATVVTFKLFDWDERTTPDVRQRIERAKAYLSEVSP